LRALSRLGLSRVKIVETVVSWVLM
jgi:hypothetical protein